MLRFLAKVVETNHKYKNRALSTIINHALKRAHTLMQIPKNFNVKKSIPPLYGLKDAQKFKKTYKKIKKGDDVQINMIDLEKYVLQESIKIHSSKLMLK